jgi:DNA-binding transcriptional MerR regulator
MSTLGEITYSISEVEKMSGGEISQKQIRYWEKKGYFTEPVERNVCGDIAYRRFTQSQVEFIRAIKGYLDHGYTLARAAELALTTEQSH